MLGFQNKFTNKSQALHTYKPIFNLNAEILAIVLAKAVFNCL